jgi:hypothetical protein
MVSFTLLPLYSLNPIDSRLANSRAGLNVMEERKNIYPSSIP